MKRFKFRLDPVIRYREYLEWMAQIDLAREQRARFESKNRISEIEQTRLDVVDELDRELTQGIEVKRHQAFTAYLSGLLYDVDFEHERLIEIGKRIREKQQAVRAESIKKKTLEWIKQNEYNKYLEQINRVEEQTADDLIGVGRKREA